MRRFEGSVAVVTGGGHGIGRACAMRLAAEGASIVVADIDTEAAEAVVSQLPGDGLAVPCDVRDDAAVAAMAAAAAERFGRVDVLVNNVGVAGDVSLDALDEAEWQRQVDPTLHGALRCVRACLPQLLDSPGGGAVVSISSVNGMVAIGNLAYSAAKAGLINLTRNLAVDYGPRAQGVIGADRGWVRFNVVAPGTIRTRAWTRNQERREALAHMENLYPMGRAGEPEEVAAAVAFLASADAAWITGITLPVEGGFLTGPAAVLDQLG